MNHNRRKCTAKTVYSGTPCKRIATPMEKYCSIHKKRLQRMNEKQTVKYCDVCDTKVEGEHEYECVTQTRRVVLSFNFIYDMPRSWDGNFIEWHMNCQNDYRDMLEVTQKAIRDYNHSSMVDKTYTEEREFFPFRYVSEGNKENIKRLGSGEEKQKRRKK